MNKTELIARVAEQNNITKKEATKYVDSTFSTIIDALTKGQKVQLAGFGSFEVRTRAARIGINPQTKKEMKIESSKIPAFKAGKAFKEVVN